MAVSLGLRMARIHLTMPQGQKTVELQANNSLGRHPNNSIQLLDKIVSKEHCIIEQRGASFVLRDLGSLNGTFINQQRVNGEQELRHGDEISLGQTKGHFDASPMATAAPPPSSWVAGQGPSSFPASAGRPTAPTPASAPPVPGGFARQPPPPRHLAHGGPSSHTAPNRPVGPPGPPPPQPHRAHNTGLSTAFIPALAHPTQLKQDDDDRQIGAEIVAVEKEFRAFHELESNPQQLRADYERLRLSYELTRDIADETDTTTLLEKILKSIFRFIPAQRGVIFLLNDEGKLNPYASHRNDGSKEPISVSTTILHKVETDRKAVLTHDAAMDFAASKGKSMILNQIQSAMVAPMLHNNRLFGVLWLDSRSLAQFQPKDLELVCAVANQAAMFIEINILGKQVHDEILNRERLSRLVSPKVAEQVIAGQIDLKPGGARTECTVFNSDIRGFTRMSEKAPPEVIVEMLNGYFERMVDVVFHHEGTLDKFMGDGIMALWGAPVEHVDDASRAVECALAQVDVLGSFNRERLERDEPPLGVGFGIHTGSVVAGYIGSSKTLSYTVIGDVANTSARLCSRALAGQIIISATTRAKLDGRFEVEELPPAKMKGKGEAMAIFNVIGRTTQVAVPESTGVGPYDSTGSEPVISSGAVSKSADTSPAGNVEA